MCVTLPNDVECPKRPRNEGEKTLKKNLFRHIFLTGSAVDKNKKN